MTRFRSPMAGLILLAAAIVPGTSFAGFSDFPSDGSVASVPPPRLAEPAGKAPDGSADATGAASGRALGTGVATWYGPGFHGRRTASGERFDAGALTAAHRSLPFGSLVRVTSARTGRSVVVRINDRGPSRRSGAVIDLSRASAQAIGMGGTAPVHLAALGD